MRTILGPAAQAIGRRGIALERAAMVTLRRDAYADPPGPTLGLAIGERTTYRPGAWVFDPFEREALGDTYAAWGGSAGLTLGPGGVTAAVGAIGMATHPRVLPRDGWAAVVIGALSGDAEVGVLLRAGDPAALAAGYRITATPTLTVIERLEAGVASSLASVATPWRAGAWLRAVWAWDALRVYQDAILVAEVTDAGRLGAGLAGMVARRGDGAAAATITAFLGGEARQEWLGAGLDLGDVQRALGQPATFAVTLSNVAPMGGAERVAALLRHGLNLTDTYDLDRGAVRVLTVVDGQSPPLTAGVGLIDGVAEITEDRVSLACRGRDAFLTPQLAAGPVTYLAGPPPGGLTPLPADPCAPSTPPAILPGDPPAEPVDPPVVAGIGPEAPPAADGGGGEASTLLGVWVIDMGYDDASGTPVLSPTTVTAAADVAAAADPAAPVTIRLLVAKHAGTGGTESAPHFKTLRWLYRGPDVVGTHLVPADPLATSIRVAVNLSGVSGTLPATLTFTVHRYLASGIHTEADLAALHPPVPDTETGDLPGTLPAPVETLATWTFSAPWGGLQGPVAAIVLNQFAGPQLLGLEVAAGHFAGWDGTLNALPFGGGVPSPPAKDLTFGTA